jgi:hypothetical protein
LTLSLSGSLSSSISLSVALQSFYNIRFDYKTSSVSFPSWGVFCDDFVFSNFTCPDEVPKRFKNLVL